MTGDVGSSPKKITSPSQSGAISTTMRVVGIQHRDAVRQHDVDLRARAR